MMFKIKEDANKRLRDEIGFLIGFQIVMYALVVINAWFISTGNYHKIAYSFVDDFNHVPFFGFIIAKAIEIMASSYSLILLIMIILIILISIRLIVDCVFEIAQNGLKESSNAHTEEDLK